MSLNGSTSSIPDAQSDLHAHIRVVADAMMKMVFDNFHYHLSPGVVNLIKDFLNTLSLQYIIDSKRKDLDIKQRHIQSLVKYGKIPENRIDTNRATTDDIVSKSYPYEPLCTLVLTLKLFHQFLVAKKSGKKTPTFQNCFISEFHFFTNVISAALIANKLIYDQISARTSDIDGTLIVLHENILRLFKSLFLKADLNENPIWSCNLNSALKLLKIVKGYEALSENEIALFTEVERLMPEAGKAKFRDLYQQLFLLSKFKSYEQQSTDRELFYNDNEETSDSSDSEIDRHSQITQDISEFEDENDPVKFAIYENEFLKIIDFDTNCDFTLYQACELLANTKKYVAASERFYSGFNILLSAFGKAPQSEPYELAITRPTQRQMTCLFEHFAAMQLNPLKPSTSHENDSLFVPNRPTLRARSH